MKIILSSLFILSFFITHAQDDFYTYDTLYHKYAIKSAGFGRYENSEKDKNDKEFFENYFCGSDSVVGGEFFFALGVCISSKEAPFYFIKISYLPIIDNWLYDNELPVKLSIRMIDEDYTKWQPSESLYINSISGKKNYDWYSLHYMGLDLKSNCNIFKLSSLDAENLFKYGLREIVIKRVDNENILCGASGYDLTSLIKKTKAKISVSTLSN